MIIYLLLFVIVPCVAMESQADLKTYFQESIPASLSISPLVVTECYALDDLPDEIAIPAARVMFYNGTAPEQALEILKRKFDFLLPAHLRYMFHEVCACAYFYGRGVPQDIGAAHDQLEKARLYGSVEKLAALIVSQLISKSEIYSALQFDRLQYPGSPYLGPEELYDRFSDQELFDAGASRNQYRFSQNFPAELLCRMVAARTHDRDLWIKAKAELADIAAVHGLFADAQLHILDLLALPDLSDEQAIRFQACYAHICKKLLCNSKKFRRLNEEARSEY